LGDIGPTRQKASQKFGARLGAKARSKAIKETGAKKWRKKMAGLELFRCSRQHPLAMQSGYP